MPLSIATAAGLLLTLLSALFLLATTAAHRAAAAAAQAREVAERHRTEELSRESERLRERGNDDVLAVLGATEARLEGGDLDIQPELAASIRRTLAEAYRNLGEYGRAAVHLEKADEIDPGKGALLELARVYVDAGRYEEADDVLATLDTFEARLLRALSYAGRRDLRWHATWVLATKRAAELETEDPASAPPNWRERTKEVHYEIVDLFGGPEAYYDSMLAGGVIRFAEGLDSTPEERRRAWIETLRRPKNDSEPEVELQGAPRVPRRRR